MSEWTQHYPLAYLTLRSTNVHVSHNRPISPAEFSRGAQAKPLIVTFDAETNIHTHTVS
jgi:hypothetical protein